MRMMPARLRCGVAVDDGNSLLPCGVVCVLLLRGTNNTSPSTGTFFSNRNNQTHALIASNPSLDVSEAYAHTCRLFDGICMYSIHKCTNIT